MTTTQIALRLPDELLARIDALAAASHGSRSGAIRRAIELYLYQVECERDARTYERLPLTEAELASAADPDAWKGTPSW